MNVLTSINRNGKVCFLHNTRHPATMPNEQCIVSLTKTIFSVRAVQANSIEVRLLVLKIMRLVKASCRASNVSERRHVPMVWLLLTRTTRYPPVVYHTVN